jgi:hypothetical protein
MSIFRSCPSTNDLSESSIASSKFEKKRTPMADWSTIESTTIMKRNKTKDFFENLKNNDENKFDSVIQVLSSTNEKKLIDEHKSKKLKIKQQRAFITKRKIDKKKSLLLYQQKQKEKAINVNLLSLNELYQKLNSSECKSKTKKIALLKEQLKLYRIKYSNLKLDKFPKIKFSSNGKPLNEQELTNMLKQCIEIIDQYHQNNQNENKINQNINNNYVAQKRMRDYQVVMPNSKKTKIITLPNTDCINF